MVTYVGANAFSGGTGLASVTIPSSVTNLGGGTFAGCSSLLAITVPGSIGYLGDGTFQGCSSLVSAHKSGKLLGEAIVPAPAPTWYERLGSAAGGSVDWLQRQIENAGL